LNKIKIFTCLTQEVDVSAIGVSDFEAAVACLTDAIVDLLVKLLP